MADGFTTDEVTDVIEKSIKDKVLGDSFYKALTTTPRDLAKCIQTDILNKYILTRR